MKGLLQSPEEDKFFLFGMRSERIEAIASECMEEVSQFSSVSP